MVIDPRSVARLPGQARRVFRVLKTRRKTHD
jgi:hypothetical protein